MPKFLFWNLNKRPIPGFVRHVVREHDVEVLILAECVMTSEEMLVALNEDKPHFQWAWGICESLKWFVRFDWRMMKPVVESSRVSIRSLEMPAREPILVAAAHLPSKMGFSDESQWFESVQLAGLIEQAEAAVGHHRTMLLGDLNMNPFEAGMVGARGGLNAVGSRRIASRDTRTVQREKYKFFYNPMWNHLGDRTETGGTFFYEHAEPVCCFWNMYDQVLLRPELLEGFTPDDVSILSEVRGLSLLENGRPDKEMASDHLPVMVNLNF
jgi:hypothetical protein